MDAYEAGKISVNDYTNRVEGLEEKMEQIVGELAGAEQIEYDETERTQNLLKLADIRNDLVTELRETDDPQLFNQDLRNCLEQIVVYPDKSIELKWR